MVVPAVKGIRVRACWTAVASLILVLTGCEPLQRDELSRGVETIQSIAAEGAILARQAAHDRTKQTFVRVHAAELSSSAEHEAEKLNDADPDKGLDQDVQRAIDVAGAEGSALDDLRTSPDDPAQARKAQQMLEKASSNAQRLLEEL